MKQKTPWTICDAWTQADREKGLASIVDRATGHDIAECKLEHAPLIAAAPDMLAALEEIANENPDNLSGRDELIRCASIARAVLQSIHTANPQTA